MEVLNMKSAKGNPIANQFVIRDGETVYFQSYDSVIVKKVNGEVFLDLLYWDYSVTTGKYRNLFLGETKAETQKKIDSGEYQLLNLN